nr:ComEC/Rec2 family competence protein [Galbibacter mesophilus]
MYLSLTGLLFLLLINRSRKIAVSAYFGFLVFLLFIGIGVVTATIHSERNSNHYLKKYTKGANVTFQITERLKPTAFHNRYFAEVLRINGFEAQGKFLFSLERDSLTEVQLLKVDDIYETQSSLKEIPSPLNPHQFNYKNYLKSHQVHRQLTVTSEAIQLKSSETNTLRGLAARFHDNINHKLEKYDHPNEIAVVKALLLGQRQDISAITYQQYAAAGAIHLLAISGLHVGLVLLFLNFLLKPIENLRRGKLIKLILTIIILWSFALVAGLSASVVRAVTMFSFIAYGMHLNRTHNIYHAIISSMFIILLFKPSFIFDVGFQLSYTAVLGIVWIQPLLSRYWIPRNKVSLYFWQLLTVTFAAQLSVLPLSLYYFHQFPSLFFLSNLIIVPCIGVLLGLGFLLIALLLLNVLPNWLANLYFEAINLMNSFVAWIANQEAFLFQYIHHFNEFKLIASYILIIALALLLQTKNRRRTVFFFGSILLLIATFIYEHKVANRKNRLIVFHKSRTSEIALHEGRTLKVQQKTNNNQRIFNDYALGENIKHIHIKQFSKSINFKGNRILIVDSLSNFDNNKEVDILLLTYSPKINLERALQKIQPKQVVADGSNYRSFVGLWEKTCLKKEIPFHYTGEKGAFIIE